MDGPLAPVLGRLHSLRRVPTAEKATWLGPYNVKHAFPIHIASGPGETRHDGRYPRMQAKVTQKLLDENADDPQSLWAILLRILRAMETGLHRGCAHFYVLVHCNHGRHRSVATCLTFAKILEARLQEYTLKFASQRNGEGIQKCVIMATFVHLAGKARNGCHR